MSNSKRIYTCVSTSDSFRAGAITFAMVKTVLNSLNDEDDREYAKGVLSLAHEMHARLSEVIYLVSDNEKTSEISKRVLRRIDCDLSEITETLEKAISDFDKGKGVSR
jgi:hypothetical protein|nr:MAG TPA: hypothetical protein [Caudoviricetes sp.]